jgi:hypothetical protein
MRVVVAWEENPVAATVARIVSAALLCAARLSFLPKPRTERAAKFPI